MPALYTLIATGQVGLTNTAAQIVPSRAKRKRLILRNGGTALTVWIGPSAAVTAGIAGNGYPVDVNDGILELFTTGAVFGICTAAGPERLYWIEEYEP